MHFIRSLFAPRRPLRTFVLLDAEGRCRAFRQSLQAPRGAGWSEVNEQRLGWLGQPLPTSARLLPVAAHPSSAKALAA
ncbi:hypothetical protein I0D00_07420 [Pseudomonas lalucatii]|uniref:Uncharacterized protein n=1 Tax=Pseudomonas lalucatii TaxID=1424203 RepID=A0ABS5PZ53_9PSED|nr:hypothetical protein [Pseudomonas lalucatii]MBS7661777.1 hypothetical protein [Pseudomonas lalucatii]MBS7726289.1 hypothetical protein [Pseudomonas lalucatii]QVM88136.1 hypothetical protein I0D68_04555 [Pseudomonas lalucatii]